MMKISPYDQKTLVQTLSYPFITAIVTQYYHNFLHTKPNSKQAKGQHIYKKHEKT